jgi:hypothetical protein
MSLADRLKERFRSRLKRWIEREKSELGCAALATKRVAKKVGMSVAGIYRIVGNYPFPVKIQAHHYVAALVHTMKAPRRRVTMSIFSTEQAAKREFAR